MDLDQSSSTMQQPVIDIEDRIPRDAEQDVDNDEEAEDEGLDWTKIQYVHEVSACVCYTTMFFQTIHIKTRHS